MDLDDRRRPASAQRWTADDSALVVVDVQESLIGLIGDGPRIVANVDRLVRGSGLLGVPVFATEQYPKGLGPTVPILAEKLPERVAKTLFHAASAVEDQLRERSVRKVTLAGIEAHVCIAQTALELMVRGYAVQVPADAVGSRSAYDAEVALRRLERAGAVITTTEAVLFEWTERSDRPEFKAISALIKESASSPAGSR